MDIIFFEKQTVFWEWSLRKTVSFEKEIMASGGQISLEAYFLSQMEAIAFVILQMFFTAYEVWYLGNITRMFPIFRKGIFFQLCGVQTNRVRVQIFDGL